ncbi:hypothetical protein MP228_008279 [Amoeboaphelidium protococcarum]|nr:hypothetical protein MP228_008279 [Amoeboaphelidium protococcarum]
MASNSVSTSDFMSMNSLEVKSQIKALRSELKKYESEFLAQHGKKPAKDDIVQDRNISRKYASYSKMKNRLKEFGDIGQSTADASGSDADIARNAENMNTLSRRTRKPSDTLERRQVERKRMSTHLSTQSSVVSVGSALLDIDQPPVRLSVTEQFKKPKKPVDITDRVKSAEDLTKHSTYVVEPPQFQLTPLASRTSDAKRPTADIYGQDGQEGVVSDNDKMVSSPLSFSTTGQSTEDHTLAQVANKLSLHQSATANGVASNGVSDGKINDQNTVVSKRAVDAPALQKIYESQQDTVTQEQQVTSNQSSMGRNPGKEVEDAQKSPALSGIEPQAAGNRKNSNKGIRGLFGKIFHK